MNPRPWLPAGFSFLSGLTEQARRRRTIVAFQLFADESYKSDGGRTFVIVGQIAEAEAWASFTDEWDFQLREPPAISVLKMRHADKLRGDFNGWSEEKRDEKLKALARVINRHVRRSVIAAVDLEHHRKSEWSVQPYPLNTPTFWAYHHAIIATALELWDMGTRERFEAIYDEGNPVAHHSREFYPAVRALFEELEPMKASILPVDPIFRDDEEFKPLQAAELLAGGGRIANDRDADDSWFRPVMSEFNSDAIELSKWSRFFYEKGLTTVLTAAPHKLSKTIPLLTPDSPLLLRKCKELFPGRFK